MSALIEEIEAITRRVYRQEREHEQVARSPELEITLLDRETQDRINQYFLISHKPYLTRREAAVYLDVSERSVAEWAARPADQNPFPEGRAGESRASGVRVLTSGPLGRVHAAGSGLSVRP